MQRTPRPTHPRRRYLANAAIVALGAAVIAGLAGTVLQSEKARVEAAESAENYSPAVTYTPSPAPTEVAFLGDSFTVGTGASSRADRWTTQLSMDNQWVEFNYGYGGTNYATDGTLKGGRSYSDRLTDIVISQPDIVVVSSAGNNMQDDQTKGIASTFRELREKIPDARIIATSPYYRAEEFPDDLIAFGDDVRTGVEAVGGEYLDIGHPLKGRPEAMDEDGVHPNDLGYDLITEAIQDAFDSN